MYLPIIIYNIYKWWISPYSSILFIAMEYFAINFDAVNYLRLNDMTPFKIMQYYINFRQLLLWCKN